MSAPPWWPDWRGQRCIIVASGPSAAEANVEQAKGKARFITVNSSYLLAPWAEILYGADFAWWRNTKPEFSGLRLCAAKNAADAGCIHVPVNQSSNALELDRLGTLGWGSNSGFQALNLAVQFGCDPIILVGFDMRLDLGIHWHGAHPRPMNNPTPNLIERCRKAIDQAAPTISGLGISVINASPVSALEAFPKMTLAEALA